MVETIGEEVTRIEDLEGLGYQFILMSIPRS
jgi:hypothetical protein